MLKPVGRCVSWKQMYSKIDIEVCKGEVKVDKLCMYLVRVGQRPGPKTLFISTVRSIGRVHCTWQGSG
jgi:hypothetical protein